MVESSTSGRARGALAVAAVSALLLLLVLSASPGALAANFRRGDASTNGVLEMGDAIQTFGYLFLGSPTSFKCDDAADTNDDGKVDLSDGVGTLMYLFAGGGEPPLPGPSLCGADPTADPLTCDQYDGPGCSVGPSPPAAPTGLVAVAGNAQVSLDWNNNAELDLAGYNVYRSTTPGSGHVKQNGAPLAVSNFTDTNVTNGTQYHYRVKAIDDEAEESAFSAEASARPVAPSSDSLRDIGHVLNRLGFGPTDDAIAHVQDVGVSAYINEQLNPGIVTESRTAELAALETAHFTLVQPTRDSALLPKGTLIRYMKGTSAPPAAWDERTFDDSGWAAGATGIGYGDGDDLTLLPDMQDGYMSVFVRARFNIADLAAVKTMILRVDYDDGFVAYLNGTEVAREGLAGSPPGFSVAASSHDAGTPEEYDLTARKNLLVVGANVLAIQVHNNALTSSDLTLIPEILNRETLPGPSIKTPRSIEDLQAYVLKRAVLTDRQLEAAMATFWENHFTSDVEKLAEFFDMLQNSDATDAMTPAQAMQEALRVEYAEYEFFRQHALGNFEDLYRMSQLGVAQNIYLDNFFNNLRVPNENLAREALELFGFGVDPGDGSRYAQRDVEVLAKVLTGVKICKVSAANSEAYPDNIDTPPEECGVQFQDTQILGLGSGWKYFKGTVEPTPDGVGGPTTAWATPEFVDTAWLSGSTGIGYGDNDDATVLSDMQGNYVSVYLRRKFNVADPFAYKNLILEANYDDSFVAYINGIEVARTENLEDEGSPPAFDDVPDENREIDAGPEYFNLNGAIGALRVGENVLAIQVHNGSLDSSDLSMRPRLLDREILPGSVENGDPAGVWTTFFEPADHETASKILFQGKPYQYSMPARTGAVGYQDALGFVNRISSYPQTAEFICLKLIEKFVSDEITLQTKNTAPLYLRELLADMIGAWNSTTPKGNIKRVLETMFDATARQSAFWAESAYRAKVKTPFELIASSLRISDAAVAGTGMQTAITEMGHPLFTRDEPNGYPEDGVKMLSTTSLRESFELVQELSQNGGTSFTWNTLQYFDSRGLDTAQEIVDHFADSMYQGALSAASRALLLQFLNTNQAGVAAPLTRANATDFQQRTRDFLELLLNMPEWSFQ